MSKGIKGVIVDKKYLEDLESLRGQFAYRIVHTSIMGASGKWMRTYTKEEFVKLINTEFVGEILECLNNRNKKKVNKILYKYGIKKEGNKIRIPTFFGSV